MQIETKRQVDCRNRSGDDKASTAIAADAREIPLFPTSALLSDYCVKSRRDPCNGNGSAGAVGSCRRLKRDGGTARNVTPGTAGAWIAAHRTEHEERDQSDHGGSHRQAKFQHCSEQENDQNER